MSEDATKVIELCGGKPEKSVAHGNRLSLLARSIARDHVFHGVTIDTTKSGGWYAPKKARVGIPVPTNGNRLFSYLYVWKLVDLCPPKISKSISVEARIDALMWTIKQMLLHQIRYRDYLVTGILTTIERKMHRHSLTELPLDHGRL